MMEPLGLPTISEILKLPIVRVGNPQVVAAGAGLDTQVRWVHSSELMDVARRLRGGELVLTTGITHPVDPSASIAYVEGLSRVGAAGLVIELGRRWSSPPEAVVTACDEAGLPLIVLTEEVRFASITQTVGERIVQGQVAELRAASAIHETFTQLSLADAGPADILDTVQRLSGASVVWENEYHLPVEYRSASLDVDELLSGWAVRSRAVPDSSRTEWSDPNGWILCRVGTHTQSWGRLVLQCDRMPPHHLRVLAERAAAALALHALHARDRDSMQRRSHHELLLALTTSPHPPGLVERCESVGFPVHARHFAGLCLRQHDVGVRNPRADVTRIAVRALDQAGLPGLVCTVDDAVHVLLSMPPGPDRRSAVDGFARWLLDHPGVLVSAGCIVESIDGVQATMHEARSVLDAIAVPPASSTVHRLDDVHVRGLIGLLRHDDRVKAFVDRELLDLREAAGPSAAGLLETVRVLVSSSGGKSDAAARLHLSRQAFYKRLERAERLIGRDLDDPEVRLSLHLAFLAAEIIDGA